MNTEHALNVGAVGLVGTVLGMPLDALFLGAISGLLVLGFSPVNTRSRGLANVCISTLLAGALSPLLMGFLAHHFEFADDTQAEMDMLRPFIPVVIGGGWQWALPHLTTGITKIWSLALERISMMIGGKK